MSNVLIAFFSMTGETYSNGGVVNLDKYKAGFERMTFKLNDKE